MHKFRVVRSGPKLSPARIRALEEQLGAKLPEDYRVFLLKHNGGTPEPKCFLYKGGKELSWVDFFYSVDTNLAIPSAQSRFDTLAFVNHRHGAITPCDALVIASAARDDLLLLFYRGRHAGQVHIKCLDELPFPPDERWQKNPELGLHFVARSFTAFLDLLQPDPGSLEDEE